MTRAKFNCQAVTHTAEGQEVVLTPVVGGSDENESFFKWTPFGEIKMGIVNPNVNFTPGKDYYVDFTEVTE